MLAARLSGKWVSLRSASQPADQPAPAPPEKSEEERAQAREALRRMVISHQIEQHRSQSNRFLEMAQECIAKDDPVGAANAYRLALNNDRSNETLQGLVQEWGARAAAVQAEQHIKLGMAEAAQGRWPEAARFYVKAATGRPDDPDVLDRAAQALLQAKGDLHLAADLSRRAVALRGGVRFRITLAEVYLAAGLALNARRELAEAARLEPENSKVKTLLKSLG